VACDLANVVGLPCDGLAPSRAPLGRPVGLGTPSRLHSGALSWPLGNLGRRRDCPRAPLCRRRDRPRAPCGRVCGHASCVGAPGCFLWCTQKICAVRTCL